MERPERPERGRPSRLLARLLLAGLALALTLLVVEGGLSFAGGRSLRTLLYGEVPEFRTLQTLRGDGSDGAATVLPPLPSHIFDIHPDPAVGRGFRRNTEFHLHEEPVQTDDIGLRVRPGPPLGEDPLRIAVLGDSVAFGWGLKPDQTLGAILERLLAEHRAPGSRPVQVRTVAVPGWNASAAANFLLDHWDELDPDIVLLLPVANDLSDGISTYWSGFGEILMPDLLSADPWFHVGYNAAYLKTLVERRQRGEVRTSLRDVGARALECGLGPESQRRFDEMARTIAALHERLGELRCRLYVVPYVQNEFWWMLNERLLATGVEVPVIPLLGSITPADTLPTDAHPNAQSSAAFAGWVAEALLATGDVPGPLARPLPQPPAGVAARRGRQRPPSEVADLAETARQTFRESLRSEVNIDTGQGCLQVYGALDGAGRVQARLLVLLGRDGGTRLRIEASALPERPDLYPLPVRVEINGSAAGEFVLAGGATPGDAAAAGGADDGGEAPRQVELFELPDLGGAEAFDVKLIPARHAVVPYQDGWNVVTFRLVSISVER